jgi:hypothetical protein
MEGKEIKMRASLIKTFFLSVVVFAVALALTAVPAIAADPKPNILFIMGMTSAS